MWRILTATGGSLVAALTLGACAGSSGSASSASGSASAASSGGDPRVVNVTITGSGCAPDRPSYSTGGLTFNVANRDATGVTEIEVLDGRRIIGEKENLPPGFAGTFAINMTPGTYTLYCPGASTERGTFTVTGTATSTAPSDISDLLAQGTQNYGGYVENQVALLVQNVGTLNQTLSGTDLAAAQAAYAKARTYYERIEPVAESFGDLDPAIDSRADDVAPTKLTGFHRIEYGCSSRSRWPAWRRWALPWWPTARSLRASPRG